MVSGDGVVTVVVDALKAVRVDVDGVVVVL